MLKILPRSQKGITLIEVMVSIVLMSITLLGIAGLLSTTTKFQLGVETRSGVTYLFNDLAGRIRANLDKTDVSNRTTWAAHYTGLAVASSTWSAQQSIDTTPGSLCGTGTTAGSACTRAQIAELDVAEIRASLGRIVPQPALQLAGNANEGLLATFIWFDKDFTVIADGETTLDTSPTCGDTTTNLGQQSCCPAAAGVGETPGVRCLNLRFVP